MDRGPALAAARLLDGLDHVRGAVADCDEVGVVLVDLVKACEHAQRHGEVVGIDSGAGRDWIVGHSVNSTEPARHQ